MNEYRIILVLAIILVTVKIVACESNRNNTLDSKDVQDSIKTILKELTIPSFNVYESIPDSILRVEFKHQDTIVLEQVVLVNNQLDSILKNTTKFSRKDFELYFYITFMKRDDDLYFEILEDYPNHYLFEIKKKAYSLHQRESPKIYGYLKYKDWDFYILVYPTLCNPEDKYLDNFIYKTGNKLIIKKKDQDYPFVQENPMWLYQYLEGNIQLIKSINDKGFFTNP
ncbi:hypothetical protein CLV62_13642 [Dysgonomonas alginatilytica]|uniref:Uncharacterized protein n=1 Tax=Dysgonomonas alginatilytica TaxID=1605892 RepID=A0A2V3PL34_9BACT|nr:hypothetical protein [Dysgonomonas alginatilytica]PXV59421.1 hypothetical protein CLV62_13642 [Dysgonomonas alginatilytica]